MCFRIVMCIVPFSPVILFLSAQFNLFLCTTIDSWIIPVSVFDLLYSTLVWIYWLSSFWNPLVLLPVWPDTWYKLFSAQRLETWLVRLGGPGFGDGLQFWAVNVVGWLPGSEATSWRPGLRCQNTLQFEYGRVPGILDFIAPLRVVSVIH